MGLVTRALGAHLPALGIRACAISRLVQRPGNEPTLEFVANLGDSLRMSGAQAVNALGIDATLEHQAAVVVLPLEHAGAPVGLAAFSWGAHNPILYEQLREVLGGAVHALGEG
jgi:hypothetical protein